MRRVGKFRERHRFGHWSRDHSFETVGDAAHVKVLQGVLAAIVTHSSASVGIAQMFIDGGTQSVVAFGGDDHAGAGAGGCSGGQVGGWHRQEERAAGAEVREHLAGDGEPTGFGLQDGDEYITTGKHLGDGFEGLERERDEVRKALGVGGGAEPVGAFAFGDDDHADVIAAFEVFC